MPIGSLPLTDQARPKRFRPSRSKRQPQPPQAVDRRGHQGVLVGLVLGRVRHREAQEGAGVVPRHAADRLLGDEELRRLLGVGERPAGAGLAAP